MITELGRTSNPSCEAELTGGETNCVMRFSPRHVGRIINSNTKALSNQLSELRDTIGTGGGSLILDCNGYRMVGLALSVEETAIKVREE